MNNKKELIKKEEKNAIQEAEKPVFIPNADIYEDGNSFIMKLDMPGVSQNGVDIELEENVMTISGNSEDFTPQGSELIYSSYTSGSYRRSFSLPADIDRDKIVAKMKDGVLTVTIPKSDEAKPKKIKVLTE